MKRGFIMEQKKWYQKTGWIIALLILFFPIGLFLMWKYANWNKIVKIIITVLFALSLIGNMTSPSTPQSEDLGKAQTESSTEATEKMTDTEPETNNSDSEIASSLEPETESSEPESTESGIDTDSAILADAAIMQYVSEIDSVYLAFVSIMESGSDLDIYDAAKTLKSSAFKAYTNITSVSCDGIDEYKETSLNYAITIQMIAENIIKYFDKNQEMKYLSDAKENISNRETLMYGLIANRMTFLSNAGLSDDEITSLMAIDETETTAE